MNNQTITALSAERGSSSSLQNNHQGTLAPASIFASDICAQCADNDVVNSNAAAPN